MITLNKKTAPAFDLLEGLDSEETIEALGETVPRLFFVPGLGLCFRLTEKRCLKALKGLEKSR